MAQLLGPRGGLAAGVPQLQLIEAGERQGPEVAASGAAVVLLVAAALSEQGEASGAAPGRGQQQPLDRHALAQGDVGGDAAADPFAAEGRGRVREPSRDGRITAAEDRNPQRPAGADLQGRPPGRGGELGGAERQPLHLELGGGAVVAGAIGLKARDQHSVGGDRHASDAGEA